MAAPTPSVIPTQIPSFPHPPRQSHPLPPPSSPQKSPPLPNKVAPASQQRRPRAGGGNPSPLPPSRGEMPQAEGGSPSRRLVRRPASRHSRARRGNLAPFPSPSALRKGGGCCDDAIMSSVPHGLANGTLGRVEESRIVASPTLARGRLINVSRARPNLPLRSPRSPPTAPQSPIHSPTRPLSPSFPRPARESRPLPPPSSPQKSPPLPNNVARRRGQPAPLPPSRGEMPQAEGGAPPAAPIPPPPPPSSPQKSPPLPNNVPPRRRGQPLPLSPPRGGRCRRQRGVPTPQTTQKSPQSRHIYSQPITTINPSRH